jgi:hypothetical protein
MEPFDHHFDAHGNFLRDDHNGSHNILIDIGKSGYKLSEFKPDNPANVMLLRNIVNYYRNDAGIAKDVSVGISPSSFNGEGGSLSFASVDGIFISAKGGINAQLNNYYNLVSVLDHENNHWNNKDPQKTIYKFLDHVAVYEAQINDAKIFSKTDNDFKRGEVTKYAGYLYGSYNANEIDEKTFNSRMDNINKSLKSYGIGIDYNWGSSSGKPLISVHGKDNNGKQIESKDYLSPMTNPR